MPKARERDGVYYRKDRGSWWVSYTDSNGRRQREAMTAHTRPQAVTARAGLMLKAEIEAQSGETAAEIDPFCNSIGGHIHIAAVTPDGFKWMVPPATQD